MKLAVSVCQPKTSRTSIKGRERREGSIISRGQHVRTPFLCRFPRLLATHPIRAIPADRVHCTCPNALATASRAQCISSVASSCMQGHVCRRPSFLPSFLASFSLLSFPVLVPPFDFRSILSGRRHCAAPFNQFSLYPSTHLSILPFPAPPFFFFESSFLPFWDLSPDSDSGLFLFPASICRHHKTNRPLRAVPPLGRRQGGTRESKSAATNAQDGREEKEKRTEIEKAAVVKKGEPGEPWYRVLSPIWSAW